MGHVELARTARAHAVRSALYAWAALSLVLFLVLALPHPWVDAFVPFGVGTAAVGSAVLGAAAVALLPLRHLGESIVGVLRTESVVEVLRTEHADTGRLRNVADEVALAIGERADRIVVHESDIPNVGAFPTLDGVVVMATSQAVEQLRRDELEALVAAQFAGMRDRWCRLATRAELVWKYTIVLSFVSILVAVPVAVAVGMLMIFLPRGIEATRDLCADVAAVAATRHPAALASALRHLAPSSDDTNRQKISRAWYVPLSPFLVLPKRMQSTTTVTVGRRQRTYTHAEEVAFELDLRADRAEALANGVDPREYTGREYRRRWSRLGADD